MFESAKEQLKSFEGIADLQEKLINIDFDDENSASSLYDEIINSNLINSKLTFRSVLVSIYTCYLSRPHLNLYYADLFIKLAKLPQNPFKSDDYLINFSNNFLIYQLFEVGLVTIDSIHQQAQRSEYLFRYFYPELKQNFPDSPLFKVQKRINYTNYETIKKSVLQYYHLSNEASENREDLNSEEAIFKKYIELRSIGHNPDPIATLIRDDDVEKLQKLISQTNMQIDTKLNKTIFESCVFLNNKIDPPSLIEYAAYFGSIKCFKFLYQQLPALPKKISEYAVAGGDYEIIHLCEMKKAEFDSNCLNLAIRFFRNEILDYLEENFSFEKTISSAAKSIIFYNLGQLINHKKIIEVDPNDKDENGYTLLSLACLNGDLDVVNYLITTFADKININEPNLSNNRPFYFAAGAGHLDIVKYLASKPEIDINASNSCHFTALHNAAGKGHLNVVKYLCSLKNIDINNDCGRNFRPIDNAVLYGNVDVIEYLSSLDNAILFNDSNLTILENAVYSRRLDIVKLVFPLVENIFVNQKNETFQNHKKNAQNVARTSGLFEIMFYLENHNDSN